MLYQCVNLENMTRIVFFIIILFRVILVSACTTRYYLVRHAEKACDDCASCGLLNPQGTQRALTLRDSLLTKSIDTIFASECLRTQQTAQPLANQLNKSITTYQTTQLTSFIQTLKKFSDNRSILVVGHSNQIPVIIDSLTHQQIAPIGSNDFDNLYIVTKKKGLSTTYQLQIKTYGQPSG